MPELYFLYAAFCIVFALASLLICFVWSRILGESKGFGFWAASLITMPAISALYGAYSIASYEGCPTGQSFAFWCVTENEHMFSVGLFNFLIIPIFCLCVSVPVTMWFSKKRNSI